MQQHTYKLWFVYNLVHFRQNISRNDSVLTTIATIGLCPACSRLRNFTKLEVKKVKTLLSGHKFVLECRKVSRFCTKAVVFF